MISEETEGIGLYAMLLFFICGIRMLVIDNDAALLVFFIEAMKNGTLATMLSNPIARDALAKCFEKKHTTAAKASSGLFIVIVNLPVIS